MFNVINVNKQIIVRIIVHDAIRKSNRKMFANQKNHISHSTQ